MEFESSSPSKVVQKGSESQGTFVPTVEEHMKPKVGMEFGTLAEAEKFYKNYGKAAGFDVRNSTTNTTKIGALYAKSFVCSKEGLSKSQSEEVRRTGTCRTGCKAMIRFKLISKSERWEVFSFKESHNHAFTSPGRIHLMKLNREVSVAKKQLIKQFVGVAIPTNKQMAFFEQSSGGYANIGCTEVDVRNYGRDMREELAGHDAKMMIDYFADEKRKNPMYVYAYELDDTHRLTHCFWADSNAIINGGKFGDVISFDATHNTNQYKLVFVAFVGINHHRKSIFLGCGLIPNEEADSFIWVFNQWVKAMGHQPQGIVTDQDLGISKAIDCVFPNIRHRYCVWHLQEKFPKKIGLTYWDDDFKKPFLANIYTAETPEEFEKTWKWLIDKHALGDNEQLQELYAIREKWAPAYHRNQFWAGMLSTQRSESMNSVIKGHASQKNSLHDFVHIIERILARQREDEVNDDHRSMETRPKLMTKWLMEKQMSEMYTRAMFYFFRDQLTDSLLYNIGYVEDRGADTIYYVNKVGVLDKSRQVILSMGTETARCSCAYFEFHGIPCRHILAMLKYSNVKTLPDQYICTRWCQTVRQRRGGSRYKPWHGESGMLASRYAELFAMATGLVESGLCSDESYIMVRDAMATLQTRLDNLKLKNVEDVVDDEGGWNHNHPWGHLMTLFKIQVKPEQKAGPAE